MSIRERALVKAQHVREQIQALEEGGEQLVGLGMPTGAASKLAFQRWRLEWLEAAAEKTEADLQSEAHTWLALFALHRHAEQRVALDMCRLVLGCENLEELLARLDLPKGE